MSNTTACSVAECAKASLSRGLCSAHYMRLVRYGDPTFRPVRQPKEDLIGRRFGSLVVVARVSRRWECRCDCGATTVVRTGCLNRGSTSTCGNHAIHLRRDDIGYSAAHMRLRSDRGSVREYECVDCGDRAQHWSYNHDDPKELFTFGLSANAVAYSADPAHYSPRCVPCHKRFDLGRTDAAPLAG